GNLGNHAADGRFTRGAAGHGFDLRGDLFDDRHDPTGAVEVDQTRGGGEDDEVLRLHQTRHQGGQRVVVAKLDFGGADGVVFVDDRDCPVIEQRFDRGLDAEMAGAGAQVFVG